MRPAARILRGPRVLLVPLVCLFSALFPVSGLVSVPWSGSVPASVGLSISLPVPEQIRMAGWGLAHAQEPPSAPDSDEWLDVEVATVGIDLATGAPLALVHQGWDEVLPIWIGDNEAQAILQVLQGIETPRPMTHDLMASMLRGLGAELVEIRIHDMREGAYIGSLHLRAGGGGDGGSAGSGSAEGDPGAGGDGGSAGSGGAAGGGGAESGGPGAGPADSQELVDVDSRPSDALALALRTGARIRVARRLLEGVPDVDFVSNERNRPIARLRGAIVTHPDRNDQARLGLPADRSGLLVRHVDDGAARQGLEAGDLIVEVGGREVTDLLGYLSVVRSAPPNSAIALTVLRNGREVEVQLPARRAPGVSG